jgi:hypothetical protein
MEKRKVRGIYAFLKQERKYPTKDRSCEARMELHCHAFAVLSLEDDYCIGFMLTHASDKDFPEHKLMKPEHFVTGWPLQFDNTYFLTVPLIKMNNLATTQEGLLSEEGEAFIRANALPGESTWSSYVINYCKEK